MSLKSQVAAVLAAGCVSFVASGAAQAGDVPEAAGNKWGAWTEFGGYGSSRSESTRGEATLWAPLMQDDRSLLFMDIRGTFFDGGQSEGNVAVGYRYLGGWNPGVWVGFDRRHSGSDAEFNQLSFGVEALSPDWDLRLNGYLPINEFELIATSTTTSAGALDIIDDVLLFVPGPSTLNTTYEYAFRGVDAEIGYRIPLERLGLGPFEASGLKDEPAISRRHHDLRVYLGAYYFDHANLDEEIAGPRVRAEWRVENVFEDWDGSRLTLEAAWQQDEVRDSQFEAGLRLRIPLGGRSAGPSYAALSPQEKRMTEGLKRDRDIVVETSLVTRRIGGGAPEPVEDAVTGVDFDSITFVQNGSDMTAALAGAGGNALLVAFGGTTNFGPSVMVANQTLLGGGGLLQVRSRTTGLLYTYAAPGMRPTFLADQAPGITAANNGHIKSLDIQGGAIGILVEGPNRVVVDDATITGSVFGLSSNGSGATLILRNSRISGGSAGIVSGDVDQTLVMQNNVFSDLGTGVVIGDASGNLTSANITATNNTFAGAYTNYLLTFPNGTVNLLGAGNVDATSASLGICIRDFFMTMNGAITFEGGGVASATTCAIP